MEGYMRFNREGFIEETTGDLGAALDCIDALISALKTYCEEDEVAEGYGGGCYGKKAEATILKMLNNGPVGEYIDI
jgi:hypothetical protein